MVWRGFVSRLKNIGVPLKLVSVPDLCSSKPNRWLNLAECLCRSGQFGEASQIATRAAKLAKETENKDWVHICASTLIGVYISIGHYSKAHEALAGTLFERQCPFAKVRNDTGALLFRLVPPRNGRLEAFAMMCYRNYDGVNRVRRHPMNPLWRNFSKPVLILEMVKRRRLY